MRLARDVRRDRLAGAQDIPAAWSGVGNGLADRSPNGLGVPQVEGIHRVKPAEQRGLPAIAGLDVAQDDIAHIGRLEPAQHIDARL